MAIDPFIERLEVKIQGLSDKVAQAECYAEMACYWARCGEFQRAEQSCQQLRATFGDGRYPRISTLIMCVEGLLLFFRDLDMAALDRLARANLLSRAFGIDDVAALSSAWIAHINFNVDNYEHMGIAINQCFERLDSENSAARGRIAIVLSDAFLLVGRGKQARYWFGVAREAAVETGDHTLVAALTYNRAALNSFLTQLRILSGEASGQAIEIVSSELMSAFGYQRLARLGSLEQLLHLALVGTNIFKRDFESAWRTAKEVQDRFGDLLMPRQRALLVAQAGLSAVMTGREASEIDSSTLKSWAFEAEGCDAGDRALVADCCAQVAEFLGMTEVQSFHAEEMRAYLKMFKKNIDDLGARLELLSELKLPGSNGD